MHYIRNLCHLFILTISLFTLNAQAYQMTPVAGKEYTVLDRPQAVIAGKKSRSDRIFWLFLPGL